MNVERIRREFAEAQNSFEYVELHPTYDGKVYARAALQTPSQMYVVSIRFPEAYPNEMPRVSVDAPTINHAPHRYNNGLICYLHPTMWNPGTHDLKFVIWRTAKWLNKYEVWTRTGRWPGAQISH